MKEHGFLKTFIAVCSGTEIFPELTTFPLSRVVRHLLILALICASVNIALRYHPFNVEFEDVCAVLQKELGGLDYTAAGVVPKRSSDKPHSIIFDDLRVDYFPKPSCVAGFKPDEDCAAGILWTPRSIILWGKSGSTPVPLLPLLIPMEIDNSALKDAGNFYWQRLSDHPDSTTPLQAFAKIYEIPPSQPILNDSPYFRNFKSNILGVPLRVPTLYVLYLASEMLLNILLISPMYILVFTVFSASLGRSDMLGLKFRQLLVTSLYTGVPGTVVATLYTALELPYLDFQSVFLISYLVYSFPVFNRLRREFAENKIENRRLP